MLLTSSSWLAREESAAVVARVNKESYKLTPTNDKRQGLIFTTVDFLTQTQSPTYNKRPGLIFATVDLFSQSQSPTDTTTEPPPPTPILDESSSVTLTPRATESSSPTPTPDEFSLTGTGGTCPMSEGDFNCIIGNSTVSGALVSCAGGGGHVIATDVLDSCVLKSCPNATVALQCLNNGPTNSMN